MVGYHITTWDTWLCVQKVGLVPYPLPIHLEHLGPEILRAGNDHTNIIWLWPAISQGENLIGCVVDRLCAKGKYRIVLLSVQYEKDDEILTIIPPYGDILNITHTGTMCHPSNQMEHPIHLNEPVVLLRNTILPQNITLVGDFDLVSMFAEQMRPL